MPVRGRNSDAPIQLVRDDGVLRLTLNRPHRKNAMTLEAWRQLGDALRSVDERRDRVLVISGAGDTFCAGADLGDRHADHTALETMRIVSQTCLALYRLRVPSVAAVDGAAVGAGMNLALMCDFVITTERAKWSEIFVRRALSVDFGGSWLLPRLVGLARAKELVLLGDFVTGAQLKELGAVHKVVHHDRLQETVQQLTERLAAAPHLAIGQSKSLLNSAFDLSLEDALELESKSQSLNMVNSDAREAAKAFIEKREPQFGTNGVPSQVGTSDVR